MAVEVRKAFEELINFLTENKEKKVNTVLAEAIRMASARTRQNLSNTFIKDMEGNVVAIQCGYFKHWMPLVGEKAVVFGNRKGSGTGLNAMCATGLGKWTTQQTAAQNAKMGLLGRLKANTLAYTDIEAEEKKIEDTRIATDTTDLGFAEKSEVIEYLEAEGFELPVVKTEEPAAE